MKLNETLCKTHLIYPYQYNLNYVTSTLLWEILEMKVPSCFVIRLNLFDWQCRQKVLQSFSVKPVCKYWEFSIFLFFFFLFFWFVLLAVKAGQVIVQPASFWCFNILIYVMGSRNHYLRILLTLSRPCL